ncbi:MAG: HD domain-containing phosphohydrolase [Planctomycetota bacterium]|nr:HD domain-containing phosphohydrolase [Planctomycetota bacterium]
MRSGTWRRTLAGTLIVQAAILGIAWAGTVLFVRAQGSRALSRTILDKNVETAQSLAAAMAGLGQGELEYGSERWSQVQDMIEHLDLPAGGFACLIGPDGRVLCHPEIRTDQSLRELNLGAEMLRMGNGRTVALAEVSKPYAVPGQVRFSVDGVHYVAAQHIPAMNARLLVHQPESGLASVSQAAMSGVGTLGLATGVFVLGLTGVAVYRQVRRHDRAMDEVRRGLEHEVHVRIGETLNARNTLIFGLAKLADCRDTDTGRHLERIADYCALLAGAMRGSYPEIDDAWAEDLRVASSLHDIGKVGICDEVLLKPGALTPEERTRMQRHTVIGADTLIAIRGKLGRDALVEMAVSVAYSHHERWDGAGYPAGLKGTEIPLAARIVALADVYDALTSARVYKAAMPHEKAARIIREGAGTQFDPKVVEAFDKVEAQFASICERSLRDSQAAAESAPRLAA